MRIKSACFGALLSISLAFGASAESAADFPTGTFRIMVPFAAGGPTDVVARILGDLLSVRWGGKPVVIENRPAPEPLSRPPPSPKPRRTATPC